MINRFCRFWGRGGGEVTPGLLDAWQQIVPLGPDHGASTHKFSSHLHQVTRHDTEDDPQPLRAVTVTACVHVVMLTVTGLMEGISAPWMSAVVAVRNSDKACPRLLHMCGQASTHRVSFQLPYTFFVQIFVQLIFCQWLYIYAYNKTLQQDQKALKPPLMLDRLNKVGMWQGRSNTQSTNPHQPHTGETSHITPALREE